MCQLEFPEALSPQSGLPVVRRSSWTVLDLCPNVSVFEVTECEGGDFAASGVLMPRVLDPALWRALLRPTCWDDGVWWWCGFGSCPMFETVHASLLLLPVAGKLSAGIVQDQPAGVEQLKNQNYLRSL